MLISHHLIQKPFLQKRMEKSETSDENLHIKAMRANVFLILVVWSRLMKRFRVHSSALVWKFMASTTYLKIWQALEENIQIYSTHTYSGRKMKIRNQFMWNSLRLNLKNRYAWSMSQNNSVEFRIDCDGTAPNWIQHVAYESFRFLPITVNPNTTCRTHFNFVEIYWLTLVKHRNYLEIT